MKTANLTISPRSGSAATIINGARSAPTASRKKYITGDASDRDKFQKWAETLETAIGNPLYHWSHLELNR